MFVKKNRFEKIELTVAPRSVSLDGDGRDFYFYRKGDGDET